MSHHLTIFHTQTDLYTYDVIEYTYVHIHTYVCVHMHLAISFDIILHAGDPKGIAPCEG